MPSFGQLLREKRREARISQRDLAARAKVDFSYISKLENERMPPPAADTVVVICRVLNVDPAELLAAARKLRPEVEFTLGSSAAAQSFLENASRMGLTDEEWRDLTSHLHRLREN